MFGRLYPIDRSIHPPLPTEEELEIAFLHLDLGIGASPLALGGWMHVYTHPPIPILERHRSKYTAIDQNSGGAEQLVVNAAVALQRRGHRVRILTSHHDPGHCFAETRGEGACVHVDVCGLLEILSTVHAYQRNRA